MKISMDELKELLADRVPVIRCEHCRWNEDQRGGLIHCSNINKWFMPDFYCADGELLLEQEDIDETKEP